MPEDHREILGRVASDILRGAARDEEVADHAAEVHALAAIGLLRLVDESDLAKGYVITVLGSAVVEGKGRVRLADETDSVA